MQIEIGARRKPAPFLGQEQTYIRVFGARRSGNHAIIRFLMQNCRGSSAFFNTTSLKHPPTSHLTSLEADGEILYLTDENKLPGGRKAKSAGEFLTKTKRALETKDNLFAFMEGQIRDAGFYSALTTSWGGMRAQDIVVYRGFMNWIASVHQHPRFLGSAGNNTLHHFSAVFHFIHHWAAHVTAALEPNDSKPLIAVKYESWLANEAYRAALLERLDLPQRDLSLPQATPYGQGSSFIGYEEGQAIDAKTALALGDRSEAVKDDPVFRQILRLVAADPDMVAFVKDHFPEDHKSWMALVE